MAVFVRTPSMEELKRRLQKRNTESEETLKRRIDKATYEVTFEDRFDCTLVNDDLQKAKDEALEIVMGFLK